MDRTIAALKDITGTCEPVDSTAALADAVARRDLDHKIDPSLYADASMDSLARLVADFHIVWLDINRQSGERGLVSRCVLCVVIKACAADWACERFKEHVVSQRPADMPTYFVAHMLQSVCDLVPIMHRQLLTLTLVHAGWLVLAEKRYPSLVPQGLSLSAAIMEKCTYFTDDMTADSKIAELSKGIEPSEVEYGVYEDYSTPAGKPFTEVRADGFVNVDMLMKSAGKNWREYFRRKPNREFVDSIGAGGVMRQSADIRSTTWVDKRIALHAAAWVGKALYKDLVAALGEAESEPDEAVVVDDCSLTVEDDVLEDIPGYGTQRRKSDNYVEGGRLNRFYGRKWANYIQPKSVNKMIIELSEKTGVPRDQLIKLVPHGQFAAVWVHPDIAADIVSRSKGDVEAFMALVNAPFADNNITLVTDSKGRTVSAVRASDGFFNVTMITHASELRPSWRNFLTTYKALLLPLVPDGVDINGDRVLGYCGGTWAHPIEAAVFADHCGIDVPDLKDNMPVDAGIAQRRININGTTRLAPLIKSQELKDAIDVTDIVTDGSTDHGNVVYINYVGSDDKYAYLKYGMTFSQSERKRQHDKDFEICKNSFLAVCGPFDARVIEEVVKTCTITCRVRIAGRCRNHTECFRVPVGSVESFLAGVAGKVIAEYPVRVEKVFTIGSIVPSPSSLVSSVREEERRLLMKN